VWTASDQRKPFLVVHRQFLFASVLLPKFSAFTKFGFNGVMVRKELSHLGFQQLSSSALSVAYTRRSSRRNERGAKFIASKGFVLKKNILQITVR